MPVFLSCPWWEAGYLQCSLLIGAPQPTSNPASVCAAKPPTSTAASRQLCFPDTANPPAHSIHILTAMHLLTPLALLGTALALDVTLILPAYHPDPLSLPPSTHATLSSLGQRFSAPISDASTFVFRNVTPGSYLADVHCATDGFRPLRIDVGGGDVVLAWETYRGNDWDNRGEAVPLTETETVKGFQVKSMGSKLYFNERPACKYQMGPSATQANDDLSL